MNYSSHPLYWDTIEYWDKWRDDNEEGEDALLASYIDNLLPGEMERRTLPEPDECHTLALLVGHSIEPLLQTVYWYRPNQIYLLLNKGYTALTKGEDGQHARVPANIFGKIVERAIERLASRPYYPSERTPKIYSAPLRGEQPDHVFEVLLENVRGSENLVIDMTGAKKSMVAGAFLYAAFTGTQVSYVNFPIDAYNPDYGRPYGFASNIELIENPYTSFALREWEQLRQAYEQHNFQKALELLDAIIQAKPFVSLRESESIQSAINGVAKLEEVLFAYALWDSGDYRAAYQPMQTLTQTVKFENDEDKDEKEWRFEPPTAVTKLGEDYWPDYTQSATALTNAFTTIQLGQASDPSSSLFLNLENFVAYVQDEIAKIQRLYNTYEDYRSVLLRSAGLSEVLFKARLAILWNMPDGFTYLKRENKGPSWSAGIKAGESENSLFPKLIEKSNFKPMIDFLQGTEQRIQFNVKNQIIGNSTIKMRQFWNNQNMTPELLADLRNKAIHLFLSVSKSTAEQALSLVQHNRDDYLAHWADKLGDVPRITNDQVTVQPWKKICRGCGLDRFLPPNLLKEDVEDE